jgi:hypothetical protein
VHCLRGFGSAIARFSERRAKARDCERVREPATDGRPESPMIKKV